jgi:hypothetical protein
LISCTTLSLSVSYLVYTLAIDSASLVERLLEDLLKTTEGYQQLKAELNVQIHEKNLNAQAVSLADLILFLSLSP